jgi:hypothetical protein
MLAPTNFGKHWPSADTVLAALLNRLAATKKAPRHPRHARPKHIKPLRHVSVSAIESSGSNPETPWIRLCGNWLRNAGFPLNTRLVVLVCDGCLILAPEAACAVDCIGGKEGEAV